MKIRYKPELKKRASELRQNPTFSERVLWRHLRSRQMLGFQFMRQKPIDNYIVDFYCPQLLLVIEIDGITHDGKQKYDHEKDRRLREIGLHILRFDGYFVIKNTLDALEIIAAKIKQLTRNNPLTPFTKGEAPFSP